VGEREAVKIGYDISQTGSQKAGCGYFADSLIRGLARADTENQYVLYPTFGDFYFDPHAPMRCPISQRNFQLGPRHLLPETSRQFWRQPPEEIEAKLRHPDIIHANNFYCPRGMKRAKVVYTLYDLGFLENPGWTTETNRWGCFGGVFDAAQFADYVIAISEYSRNHFLRIFPHYPAERVSVVYPASRFNTEKRTAQPERLLQLKPDAFWLIVGTIEPRKNHKTLLRAFHQLQSTGRNNLPLVIAGGGGWLMDDFEQEIDALGITGDIIRAGYVDDDELGWLYANCFANIYPSLFEGFGMPVLEGMSLGAIPVAGSNSSLPEIVGDCGFLVTAEDVDDIVRTMTMLIDQKAEDRDTLKQRCLERSRKFNWDVSAKRTLEIYHEVLNQEKLELASWPSGR